ncbi:MAG: HEAT repeat domain-containing protein [Candidatus Hodarchaeota archaeon]
MDIQQFFSPVVISPLSISLIVIFCVIILLGFYIIMREIKLIKKNQILKRDYLFALAFGLMFSSAITLGAVIGIQYGQQAISTISAQVQSIYFPRLISGMFLVLYLILMAYPLLEFVFNALKIKESSMFFYQDYLNRKLLARFENKYMRLAIAVSLYVAIFLVIPVILQAIFKISFIISTILICQSLPMFTLSKLGSGGYFWGINLHYYNTLEMDRLMYMFFDDNKKAKRIIKKNLVPSIAVPAMMFVYVNSFISLAQMFQLFDPASIKEIGPSFLFSTISNIILALVGYFNKYWKKQVKYKFSEILLAGYLFVALAFNIFLNFLMKKPSVLLNPENFNKIFPTEISAQNYVVLLPVAMIQKVIFVIFVSYYFLGRSNYKKNVINSIMMVARNKLNPVPLINLLKHRDDEIRLQAKKMLLEMYRLHSMKYVPPPEPKKNFFARLFSRFFKSKIRKQVPFPPIFEALESDRVEIRECMLELLKYMIDEDAEQTMVHVNRHLPDQNSIKSIILLKLIKNSKPEKLDGISIDIFLDTLIDGGVELKKEGLNVVALFLDKIMQDDGLKGKLIALLKNTVNSPYLELQSRSLELVQQLDHEFLEGIISKDEIKAKLSHSNRMIKEQAIPLFISLQGDVIGAEQLASILDMLDTKNSKLQIAVIKSISPIVAKLDVDIPGEKISALLGSKDKELLVASVGLFSRLFEMKPKEYPITLILPVLQSNDMEFITSIIKELEPVIEKNPGEIIPFLIKILEQSNMELKEISKKYLVRIGANNFNLVLEAVLSIKEDDRFAVRNFTREIIHEIGKEIPKKVINVLQNALMEVKDQAKYGNMIKFLGEKVVAKTREENFRMNAAGVIGDLGEEYPQFVDAGGILKTAREEKSWKVKRDLALSLGKLISKIDGFPLEDYVTLLDDENNNVRNAVIKGLKIFAKNKPEAFPLDVLFGKMKDEDPFVRENMIKLVGLVAITSPDMAVPLIISGLNDEHWPVRNAAAEVIGKIAKESPEKVPGQLLKEILLHDDDKWTRWQAARSLVEVVKHDPKTLKLEEFIEKIDTKDENLTTAYNNLLRYVNPHPIKTFIKAVSKMMDSPKDAVQEQVANTIYQVHGKTKSEELISELLKKVGKEFSLNIQRTAAIALGRIVKYDSGETRNRVKKVLAARCKNARDPVICREYSAL